MRLFAAAAIVAALSSISGAASARAGGVAADGVELHAHLFMKEGLSWFFRGGFFEELHATDWTNRFSSQANPETLNRSGLKICVAALYAHPLLTLSLRDSVRRQIEQARRFVAENPQWVLARSPAEARAALARGKQVLVLALEGASGIIENDDDVREFVDRDGVRIVTLLHFTDDLFGGPAFLKGIQILANPIAAVKSLFAPTRDADDVRVNPHGLTDAGRAMASRLIAHHAWLDLAHASDASAAELIAMARKAGQPILYTHTVLRRFLRAERGVTADELQAVRETKGLVGVMPSEDMLAGTSQGGGLPALLAQAREIGLVVGQDGVVLGTDYNGGLRHLHPASGTGTSLDGEKGFWMIAQSDELWRQLSPKPGASVERFLKAWEKVFEARPTP